MEINPRYFRKLKNSYKGLRTKVNVATVTLMTTVVSLPDESKTVVKLFAPHEWVDNRWGTIVAVVGVVSLMVHLHGSAREEADIPYDYRD